MRRRDVIAALGAAAAWPVALRAQNDSMPLVGFLHTASPGGRPHLIAALRQGLADAGYDEGRTVKIEYRWADNHHERLPELAVDLVQHGAKVIVASGGTPAVRAAKAVTTTIPIVFALGSDPVQAGLVASLNRPGGNITGVSFLTDALGGKRLGLLREVMTKAAEVAVLINPKGPDAERQLRELPQAAESVGQPIQIFRASDEAEIDAAFAAIAERQWGGLLVGADAFFNDTRRRIVMLAARSAFPTIYELSEFETAGGLMSYGANLADAYPQAGTYAGRVLKGVNPADLPVLQPTKFELVINLKTAKALAIDIPPTLLARADEVIE
jgi:putative ABC transport system substrate-binding protein